MILEFAKVRPDVKTPTRSNPSDAGMDVYYCPPPGEEAIQIPPLGKAKLATGIKVALPHGFALEVMNRGSMAANKGLLVGACLVDAGYEGEIFIDLHNVGQVPQVIERGDKIAQFVVYPIVHVRLVGVDEKELFDQSEPIVMSNRGDGGFGSTDEEPVPLKLAEMCYDHEDEDDILDTEY